MRHQKEKFKLNRFSSWRLATLRSLARNLIIHQRIITTYTKACAVKPLIEKLISLGKENSLSARRQAYKILGSHQLVSLLFNERAKNFNQRIGGYTRILKLDHRRGDNALKVILELSEITKEEIKKPKKIKEKEELKPKEGIRPLEKPVEEKKITPKVLEKPTIEKKPERKFLKGLRNIFKKERDAL